jgi:DNA-binding MarR family transcriptional regulator
MPPDSTSREPDIALPLADNLLAAIHVLSGEISRAFYPAVEARYGVTLPEWRVMLTLAHRPGASAVDVVTLWGMDKMAASRAVRRLEEAGHLRREADPRDRRRQVLFLTPGGETLYRRIEPAATARYREIIGALGEGEVKELSDLLDRMVRRIRRIEE